MGDEAFNGGKLITSAAEAMLKTDPSKIQVRPKYDAGQQKWIQRFLMAGDEGFDPIAGQLFSPQNIAYLSRIWKEPLSFQRPLR